MCYIQIIHIDFHDALVHMFYVLVTDEIFIIKFDKINKIKAKKKHI